MGALAVKGDFGAMKRKAVRIERAEGPAVETPLHVWGRPATDDRMRPIAGKVACKKLTPLEAYFDKGRLNSNGSKYSADARFHAGQAYARIFAAAQPPGRDSTQALNISRSHGGAGGSDVQIDAARKLAGIEARLGARDRIIIRMVCGHEDFPSVAVAMVSADYTDVVSARFREALDSLIEAFGE